MIMIRLKNKFLIHLKDLFNLLLTKEFAASFEIMIICVGSIGFLSYLFPRQVLHMEYAGNVVTGFATSGGIIAAFTGFWLAHLNSNASKDSKKWLQKRIAVIVPFIGVCLFIVFSGLYQLAFGNIGIAVNYSALGVLLLILTVAEVSYITFYQGFKKEQIKDESSTSS
jgi:hypothetical protein